MANCKHDEFAVLSNKNNRDVTITLSEKHYADPKPYYTVVDMFVLKAGEKSKKYIGDDYKLDILIITDQGIPQTVNLLEAF